MTTSFSFNPRRPNRSPSFEGKCSQIDHDFTATDLINGKIRVEHDLGNYPKVFVWDEQVRPILPDEVRNLSSTVVEISLESFRLAEMLTSQTTWHLTIS